jgi:hypothetical protein
MANELFISQQFRNVKPVFYFDLATFLKLHSFWYRIFKKFFMNSKSNTSTVLIALLIVLTFPIWIGIAGGIFGLIVGIFGAVIGIIAGVFGAILGAMGSLFGWFFDWHWPFTGFFHWNVFILFFIILIVVMISRSRRI